jgi:hypothetical protein
MSIKNSAEKVKVAIAKHATSHSEELARSITTHQCCQVKIPRMPAKLSHLFPKAVKEIAQRKTNLISSHWSSEAEHTHAYGTHVESYTLPGIDLIPERVKRWTLKEYHVVARKIRGMGKTKDMPRKFTITIFSDAGPAAKNGQSNDLLWEEMLKAKEERHFQIGHMTHLSS